MSWCDRNGKPPAPRLILAPSSEISVRTGDALGNSQGIGSRPQDDHDCLLCPFRRRRVTPKGAVPVVTQLNPLAMDTKMPRRHMANRSNLSPCRFDKLGLTPAPKRESRASYQESLRTRPEQLVR